MNDPRPMSFFATPPLKWVGSKWQLADWIASTFPPHRVYVEPFAGSAAVFFRKHPSPIEVLNDLDGSVINFFRVLRAQPDALIRAIELTPFARDEYYESWQYSDDPVEWARQFYVRSFQSFGSTTTRRSGWRRELSATRGSQIVRDFMRLDGLADAVYALKNAYIENLPAQEVIDDYDAPDALFYVDPPYLLKTRAEGARARYVHEMQDADHIALAAHLNMLQGMVVLSGYDSPLYRQLYAGWTVLSKTTTTQGNGTATEYLWLNPACTSIDNLPLFRSSESEVQS